MKKYGSSLRSYMFYGLTLMLASVFILLAIQNHRKEKEPPATGMETVQSFQPTPIRALAPQDLEIIPASMALNQNNPTVQVPGTQRKLEILNSGPLTYGEIQLKLEYLDAGGTALASTTHLFVQKLPPGKTFLAVNISKDTIPSGAVNCRYSVVYADMETE